MRAQTSERVATRGRPGRRIRPPSPVWLSLLSAIFFGAGLLALAVSLLPAAALEQLVRAVRGEEGAGAYTLAFLGAVHTRLRIVGLGLAGIGATSWVVRGPLEQYYRAAGAATPSLLADVARGARSLATTPGWERAGLVAALLLGLSLRLAFLGLPLRYDEAFTYNEFASKPLYYALSYYPVPNNHLLHTLLVHLSTGLFGNHVWAIRLPALVAGTLVIPATYLAARALYGRASAVLASVAVAGSSPLVEYSVLSRGYSLAGLVFLAVLLCATYARRSGNRAALPLVAGLGALGIYIVPTMVYGVAIVAVWVGLSWLFRVRHRQPAPVLAAWVITGSMLGTGVFVLYVPVLLVSGPESLVANRFTQPLPWSRFAAELGPSLSSTWSLWNRDVPWVVSMVLLSGFLVGTVVDARERRGEPPLLLPVLLACGALLVLQRVVPFERVWLFLLPLYFAVAAHGLARMAGWLPGPVVSEAVATVALGTVFAGVLSATMLTSGRIRASDEAGSFPDAEAVSLALRDRLRENDAVVSLAPSSVPQIQYYFRKHGLDPGAVARERRAGGTLYVVVQNGGVISEVKEAFRAHGLPASDSPILVQRLNVASIYGVNGPG